MYNLAYKSFYRNFSIEKKEWKRFEYNKIEKWDSIGHMSLISELESEFAITFETLM